MVRLRSLDRPYCTLALLILGVLVCPLRSQPIGSGQGLDFSNRSLRIEWRRGDSVLKLTNLASRQSLAVPLGPTKLVFASGSVEGFDGVAVYPCAASTPGGQVWQFTWPVKPVPKARVGVLCRVEVELDREAPWIRKRATVELSGSDTAPLLKEVVIDTLDVRGLGARQPFDGWQSYPVLCDSFFVGVEFPVAQAQVTGQTALLTCRPGVHLGPRQPCRLKPVVYGVTAPGESRRAFEAYIGSLRPVSPPMHVQYNSWWSAPYPFSQQQMLDIITAFQEGYFKPYGGRLDSFCLDMGWANSRSMWQIDASNFPKGFEPLAGQLGQMNAGLALWVSPSSCYQSPGGLNNEWAAGQGYETFLRKERPKRFACLAGRRYATALRDALVEHTRTWHVAHYKFDGYMPMCPENTHGHEPGELSALKMAESFVATCQAVRQVNPDIWLEATCFGPRPSPWWLTCVNTVMGTIGSDSPRGRVPCPVYRESATTARDFFNLQGTRDVLIPIHAQEVLGIVHQTSDPLQNDALTVVLRGHSFLPMYLNPKFMDARRWRFLARLTAWARENASLLSHTKALALGDWADGRKSSDWRQALPRDPYGYAHFDQGRGVLLLRNPWLEPRRVTLRLDESVGADRLLKDVSPTCLYPTFGQLGGTYSYGSKIMVNLAPYETRLLAFGGYPDAPPARPNGRRATATGVHSQVDASQGKVRLAFEVGDDLPGRQLWLLCESQSAFQAPTCAIRVNGMVVEAKIVTSAGGFWSGPAAPEQWAWFLADLPTGKCSVQVDVLAQDDVRFSAWLAVRESLPDDPQSKGPIPPPEERFLDTLELQAPVALRFPALADRANLAASSRGARASASSAWSPAFTADKAIDGNAETRWNSAAGNVAGSWLAVDFGKPCSISTVSFAEAAGGRITGYKVQSWDGRQWRDVAGVTKSPEQTNGRCRFAPVTTSQVRLLITAAKGVPTIYELQVH